ncbi:ABC transporter permease [Pseudidiomarina sp. 1APR75-33.1]|uniref:FtsX-like permease family protein n=1 Tax=Pseudidiomarina terrestris TaxID=2820060 RepID=UPI002653F4FA|nr:ABC transporter permease [Pseudidiomarina sp. 1APR75-33.1]MDN7127319.1 ABC transporter permease [Pseudidiomarina sp. 1APR75-33.1]
MFKLALASLWNRRGSVWLTVVAIAVSTLLLLGVERIRVQTQENFANTISGTDLIVGARTGSTELLLSSVFHIGNLSNTLNWNSYQYLQQLPGVDWHIPMAMGDSVQGFPVIATTDALFEHFQYGAKQSLQFQSGGNFATHTNFTVAVLGAEAAAELGKTINQPLTISHGTGDISFSDHDAHPFTVAGVLARTGTPIDRGVFIPLQGQGLVHGDYLPATEVETTHSAEGHAHEQHAHEHQQESANEHSAPPVYTLSAVLLGLENRAYALRLQRVINTYDEEALSAIMPGLALQNFWRTLNLFERALMTISVLVVITGLLGMLTTLLASLRERRREMAVLRSIGAGPVTILGLLVCEAAAVTIVGATAGTAALYAVLIFGADALQNTLGIQVTASVLTLREIYLLAAIIGAAIILSFYPAWRAYRNALADGLTVKL